MRVILIALCSLLLTVSVYAEPEPEYMSLTDCLRSLEAYSPEWQQAFVKVEGQKAKLLEAQGGFDLMVGAAVGTQQFLGDTLKLKNSDYLDVAVKQKLASGPSVAAGFRKFSDTIKAPLSPTGPDGQLYVKYEIPLLRDLGINRSRYKLSEAEFAVAQEQLLAQGKMMGLKVKASQAYWKWSALLSKVAVYEEYASLARDRREMILEEIKSGVRAPIKDVEISQKILERERQLRLLERELLVARLELERLTFEDIENRFPDAIDRVGLEYASEIEELSAWEEKALASRFDLFLVEERSRILEEKRRLAVNQGRPRLSAVGEYGWSLGYDQVYKLGMEFQMPLQNRRAKGMRRQSELKLEEQDLIRKQLLRNVEIEVRIAWESVALGLQRANLASEEYLQKNRLYLGEKDLFEAGLSDVFLVNLREENSLKSQVEVIEAKLELMLAWLELQQVSAQVAVPRLYSGSSVGAVELD